MTLPVKMKEFASKKILVSVWMDILESNVKHVGLRSFSLGTLTYLITLLAICDPICEYGGTCTAPDTCECTAEYSGEQCQRGMFCMDFFLCRQNAPYRGQNLDFYAIFLLITNSFIPAQNSYLFQ